MGAFLASSMHYSAKHGKICQLVSQRARRASARYNRDYLHTVVYRDGTEQLCPCKFPLIIYYCRCGNLA